MIIPERNSPYLTTNFTHTALAINSIQLPPPSLAEPTRRLLNTSNYSLRKTVIISQSIHNDEYTSY
jgi:hypothetical protein